MPQRIQRKRVQGWKKPDGAIYVGRGSRWGNPIRITPERDERGRIQYRVHGSPTDANGGPVYNTIETARHFAARFFEWDLLNGRFGAAYPTVNDIRRELAGRDLLCWCPPGQPCHADVLLELANQ
jgi:hypothetical protein